MLGGISKAIFHALASSRILQRLASRVGMRHPASFARRFVAGETIADAVSAAQAVQSRGMLMTLDHLGENVASLDEAEAATRDYLAIMEEVARTGVDRNISLKLTQLGLDADKAMAIDNLRRILERAQSAGFFVRLDMESSTYTDVTLEIFDTVWRYGHRQVGVVLQAALRRTENDLGRLNAMGARVRLVKGAYAEPKTIAYRTPAEVDAAFVRLMQSLLSEGTYPAIATHDPAIIDAARAWATSHGIAKDRFEFQMLYGVRRDLQSALVGAGYRVRLYIPFGREWFPYFMRRLGERPANVAFVLRSLMHEDG